MQLGHMGEGEMMEFHKKKLLKDVKRCKFDFYKNCVLGKQNKVQFKIATHMTKGTLDYVHTNV